MSPDSSTSIAFRTTLRAPSAAAAPVHSVHAMLFALESAADAGSPAAYSLVASARLGLVESDSVSAPGPWRGGLLGRDGHGPRHVSGAGNDNTDAASRGGRLGRDGHGQRHTVRGAPPQARLLSGPPSPVVPSSSNDNSTATAPVTCGVVGLPDCPQNSTSDAIFAMIEGKVAVLISFSP